MGFVNTLIVCTLAPIAPLLRDGKMGGGAAKSKLERKPAHNRPTNAAYRSVRLALLRDMQGDGILQQS